MSGMLKVFDGSVWQNIGLVDPSSGGSLPYKVYTAILNQSGTSAPTATVLENTIGTITWSYESAGVYHANCSGCFTSNKTIAYLPSEKPLVTVYNEGFYYEVSINSNYIEMVATNSEDDWIVDMPIEIRVYP